MEKISFIVIVLSLVTVFLLSYLCVLVVIAIRKNRAEKAYLTKELIEYERGLFERQLYAQTDAATSNPHRFIDMNHMILYNIDGELRLSNVVADNSFFEDRGINLNDIVVEQGYVTCLMPFISSYKAKYEAIKLACEDAGMLCHRSDEEYILGDILKYTLEMILKSQILIAVLDGRNANVYYEMGIAQAVGKPVIMVADYSKMSEIPFDIRSNRMIFYKNYRQLRETLSEVLINNKAKKNESRTKETVD